MTVLGAIWVLFLFVVGLILLATGCRGIFATLFPDSHKTDYEIRILGFILSIIYIVGGLYLIIPLD